jgi:hypothetical protein
MFQNIKKNLHNKLVCFRISNNKKWFEITHHVITSQYQISQTQITIERIFKQKYN